MTDRIGARRNAIRDRVTTAMLATVLTASAAAQDYPKDSPVAAQLARADEAVAAIVAIPDAQRTFDNTIGAFDDLMVRLGTDTNMIAFMAHVSTDAAEREAGQRAEEHVTNWAIAVRKREDLYRAVKSFADSGPQLAGEQARLLERLLRDYRRAGMDLPPAQREKLKTLEMEITRLGIEFEKNIREDETRVPLTRAELAGMSDEFLAGLKPQIGDVYLVGMDYPTFIPIQDQCENETTRKKLWLAFKRKAGQKNVLLLERILRLRAEAAALLGYATPADFETEPRMARSARQVQEFYDKVRPLARKKAELDFQEFRAAKRAHTGNADATFYPWDFSFYKNRLLKEKYAVDGEKVREYFPMERVVDGLFSITQSLYGLEYRDITTHAQAAGRPLWHADARLFEVWDTSRDELLGEFYIDLYPRDHKYGHAACWGLRPRKVWSDGSVQKPIAALVCNFSKPTPDKPSRLTHDEVETFFHEFGHCLHNILTETHYGEFAGTSVARDFVEAPSQMFENWVWDANVLATFARHYQTGEPLPPALLDGMIRARHLGSALEAERQFYYGLCDLRYHTAPGGVVDTTQVANELFSTVELYAQVPDVFHQASFGHLVGYQAGYYGYQWSLVYACDMFQRFRELGMLDPQAGKYYRQKILARGGSIDELDMVKDYLGREPRMEAYLEHLGLAVPENQ